MISVPIDRIVPLTDARDNFSRLISDIETLSDGLYVLTKGGKPAIALINIKYLEEIMDGKIGENHESRITNAGSDHKPEISRKVHEPIHRPAPVKLPELPKPPIVSKPDFAKATTDKPNFEVPRITTAPIGPSAEITSTPLLSTGLPSTQLGVNGVNQLPGASLPSSNYDVKPTINPTWTGEEATAKPLAPSSLAPSQSPTSFAPVPKPEASSQLPVAPPAGGLPPIAQLDKPSPLDSALGKPPPPPTPSKPTINPWPIIPPRSPQVTEKGYESTTTVPPRRDDARDTSPATVPPRPVNTALPLAPSSLAPSPSSFTTVPKPEASSPSTGLPSTQLGVNGVNPLPEASYPKMVAPPPPPPPSSLPRIPSSFQTVPVPINGNKPPTTAPAPLPPPPITTAPAPFANTSPEAPVVTPSTPLGTNPKPADSISFDQPPTTIPEPGEDLPMPSASTSNQLLATSTDSVPAPKPEASSQLPVAPPQGQASVQDLEI
ncbi:MAG: hypothetical protein AAB669_00185 [Patescibacteria group bacterium]